MRLHPRRCVGITLVIAGIQLAVMYFGVRRAPEIVRKVQKKRVHKIGDVTTGTCNPNLCHPVRDDMLNVHLVAHSHDDVGWLKTLDQYYVGKQSVGDENSQHHGPECVRCVLNTTIPELLENPKRKFIFIEMSFFSMWWKEISKKTQALVKDLIRQRRLEFVIGGWCMSDAATTYYNDIIDQHTLGFDFIDEHFGPCAQSRVAWHVDQFGHSREHSSIFAQMGFDGIVLGRLDHQDIADRTGKKTRELVWRSSPTNLGDKASLFTHISGGYYAPQGFVMEGWNQDKVDHMDISGFLRDIEDKRNTFTTNHVMIPMGSDFGFRNAGEWFENMDKLIERVNSLQKTGSKIHMMYSTPSCYIQSVNKADKTWTTKTDDFFPYAVDNGYWTGYFTSKGGLKLHTKKAGAFLQACKQLSVFAALADSFQKTHVLKAAVAVLQHHDAITGTEKEHVVKDYNKMLSEGITQCQDVIDASYQYLISDEPTPKIHQEFCPEMNISMCQVTEASHKFAMFIYNPLSRPVVHWVRLPVTHARYSISGPGGNIPVQITPLSDSTFKIPSRKSQAKMEAVFKTELPPMGIASFFLAGEPGPEVPKFQEVTLGTKFEIGNEHLVVSFDSMGRISKMKNKDENLELPIQQDYKYYLSRPYARASGAYIFAPSSDQKKPVAKQSVKVRMFKGQESTEVHQEFSDYVSQVVRLYKDANYLELEWTVGPIPINDGQGKEVVSMFNTDLKTEGVFYTDSNGREMLKRKRDFRETWKLRIQDKISGNYYPVTGKIYIKDPKGNVQVTVLTDRCQGGSSIQDGSLELMVHRRMLNDDGLGVGEPLNERDPTGQGRILRGKHYLYVGSSERSTRFHREKALEVHLHPTLSFVSADSLLKNDWQAISAMKWSGLSSKLPPNVQIMSLDYAEANNTDVLLLRLEHFYEGNEHAELSEPATVNLQDLFGAFNIVGLEELSLGANFNASWVKRLQWKTEDGLTPAGIGPYSPLDPSSPFLVKLNPMEIRTFHIEVEENQKSSFLKHIFR